MRLLIIPHGDAQLWPLVLDSITLARAIDNLEAFRKGRRLLCYGAAHLGYLRGGFGCDFGGDLDDADDGFDGDGGADEGGSDGDGHFGGFGPVAGGGVGDAGYSGGDGADGAGDVGGDFGDFGDGVADGFDDGTEAPPAVEVGAVDRVAGAVVIRGGVTAGSGSGW
ncbi:MAG: hypothetical protein ACJ72N_03320 [Labedaea sp.]